ncbi:MAG: hypothetical protein LBQ43_03035 [Holosporales bacterium]|jgi:hypothetical protein|nr:hypothetical protein [Holosporales bacterium]
MDLNKLLPSIGIVCAACCNQFSSACDSAAYIYTIDEHRSISAAIAAIPAELNWRIRRTILESILEVPLSRDPAYFSNQTNFKNFLSF